MDLTRREAEKMRVVSAEERAHILALGKNIECVWSAPSTTDRDRKELLRTLVEEVMIDVKRERETAHVVLRWRVGLLTERFLLPGASSFPQASPVALPAG